MTIEKINEWHKRARPEPTPENLNVQIGCHFEEVVEMLDAIGIDGEHSFNGVFGKAREAVRELADALKAGELRVEIKDRQELLDALADQVVTAVGVGHCAGMAVPLACDRVNDSNWSKYVDGYPVFKPNGKIDKGPNYKSPNLEGLY